MRIPIGTSAALRRATQLEIQGRYGEAVELLRGIVAREPNYNAYVGLGRFLPMVGDLAGAESALRRAVELDPNGVQARYTLSRVLWLQAEQKRKTGADGEAKKLLEESVQQAQLTIDQKPDYGLAYLSLGIGLKQLHRNPKAIDALQKAVKYVPEVPDSYLHLGELLAADGKTADFWEANLRFKTDASSTGPLAGKPVIMPAGMMGDRASVFFAAPGEISTFIKQQC